MRQFGCKENFSIEYELIPNFAEDDPVLKYSWGKLRIWIEGNDICEYVHKNRKECYEWNLVYILEWLCDNIEYILGYDPFPLPLQENNSIELIEKSNDFDSEDDDEFYLWHQAKSLWAFKHSWFQNRAGSNLSNVYFRRVDNNIEISWDNSLYKESEIYFLKSKGKYNIPKTEFKNIMLRFIRDILNEIEKKVENDEWINRLKEEIHLNIDIN